MRRRFSLLALLAALPVATAWPAAAQQYQEHLDVRVIQVPVVVWRGGETITGLTRDSFDLYVNGAAQPIVYFDVLAFGSAGNDGVKTKRPLEERRLTMLLFDTVSSSRIELLRTRAPLEELVKKSSPDDYFGVAVYDGRSVRILAPFTGDRSSVLHALNTLERSRSADPLGLVLTADERVAVGGVIGPNSTASVEGGFSDDLITGLDDFDLTIDASRSARNAGGPTPSVDEYVKNEQEFLRGFAADSWANALIGVADALAPLPGIKQVALFSTGASLGYSQPQIMDELHRSFRRAGVTLHVIDPGGLRAPGGNASSTHPTANPAIPDILFRSAIGTGGSVIADTGVVNAVRIFSETRSVTYVLGFRPPANERQQNDIVVKLKNQPMFTSLSYRRGYSVEANAFRRVSDVFLADVMLNDMPFNDVTMKIYTDRRGTVDVGMPSNELLAHALGGWVTIDVYLYVFDEAGQVVAWKQRKTRLEEARTLATLRGAELVRRERLSLAPGRYTAKALVHVRERDLLSFRRTDFEIPSTGGS